MSWLAPSGVIGWWETAIVPDGPAPIDSIPARWRRLIADRAYLYADDRPDTWDAPEEGYYDLRWTFPLAWFFFFRPEDVHLIDVHHDGFQKQEVRLSAEKGPAFDLFERRKPLLMSLIDQRMNEDAVARFVSTVCGRRGRYLLVDPHEVLERVIFALHTIAPGPPPTPALPVAHPHECGQRNRSPL